MAEYQSKTKTSDGSCGSSLMVVAFRIGYMSAKIDQIHAKMFAQPPSALPPILHHVKEILSFLAAVYKAWPVIRWAMYVNVFGWFAKHAAKLLGWL